MEIANFRGKTAMLSTETMEKNEQLRNVRPRRGTVPCDTVSFVSGVYTGSLAQIISGGITFYYCLRDAIVGGR